MARIIDNPKELILSQAKSLAEQDGLSKLNMRKLATACDISLGTIYNYYPTKTDVMMAVIESFWDECFHSFYRNYNPELNFFEQLRCFYFCILDYLEHFKTNWLNDLTSLSSSERSLGKEKEKEYMRHFHQSLERLLEQHQNEFDCDRFNQLNKDQLIKFIVNNLMSMLRQQDHDYQFFDLVLHRLLT